MLHARSARPETFGTSLLTRQLARARSTGLAFGRAGPTIMQGMIYNGAGGSRLDGLNSSTGSLEWSFPVNGRMSSPAFGTWAVPVRVAPAA
jgi:outer membrane protein assembly factor BamB